MTSELLTLEKQARAANNARSYFDYREGSATEEYNSYCKKADEILSVTLQKLERANAPEERAAEARRLTEKYKQKKLEWLISLNANAAKVPSILICGASNFPVRAKQKQNAREDTIMRDNPDYILREIEAIGHNAKTIYTDEAGAVERIQAKIEALRLAPDPYGNKSAEIRRLKERLLQLAPELFKEQQSNTSVNNAKTYEEIIALWETGRIKKYSSDDTKQYYELSLIFTDGKRRYPEYLSFEVTPDGKSIVIWDSETRKVVTKEITEDHKYSMIINKIAGSGNKAVMYAHLKSLSPKFEEKQQEKKEDKDITINGEAATLVRNSEEVRLQLFFEGKPNDKTRELLKSNGFRWAPSCGAWQRLLNENAEYAVRRIADKS
jgi:hypothetical protein